MDSNESHTLETYKSLISISIEGLKTLLLINGGAVVALLAFLGQSPQGSKLAPNFWIPITAFVIGVFCCCAAFLGSYFTQYALFNEKASNLTYKGLSHMSCFWITLALAIISLVGFVVGAFKSIGVLSYNT